MTLRAADLMTTPVITAQADQTVAAVAATMHQHRLSFVPVTETAGGTVLGILSAADILHLEAARQDTERLKAWHGSTALLEDPPDPERLDAWLSRIEVGPAG